MEKLWKISWKPIKAWKPTKAFQKNQLLCTCSIYSKKLDAFNINSGRVWTVFSDELNNVWWSNDVWSRQKWTWAYKNRSGWAINDLTPWNCPRNWTGQENLRFGFWFRLWNWRSESASQQNGNDESLKKLFKLQTLAIISNLLTSLNILILLTWIFSILKWLMQFSIRTFAFILFAMLCD